MILHDHGITCPKTARTLLKTNKKPLNIQYISDTYVYNFDIDKIFTNINIFFNIDGPMHIPITLHIDGLPIFKSSLSSIWPILVNIKSILFSICLIYGKKPMELNFIYSTIENLRTLLHNSILFNTYKITFYIQNIVVMHPKNRL